MGGYIRFREARGHQRDLVLESGRGGKGATYLYTLRRRQTTSDLPGSPTVRATVRRGKSGSRGGVILAVGVWSRDATSAPHHTVHANHAACWHAKNAYPALTCRPLYTVRPFPSWTDSEPLLMRKSGPLTMTHPPESPLSGGRSGSVEGWIRTPRLSVDQ